MVRKVSNPMILPETAAYWQAANEGKLLIKHCLSCGLAHHYPRDMCPHCWSTDTVWRESSGQGSIYSFSTMGQGDDEYTITFIALDEGITMMSNLVSSDTTKYAIGAKVQVVFQVAANGQNVPTFILKD